MTEAQQKMMKETGDKIRADRAADEQKKLAEEKEKNALALNSLNELRKNEELAKMYQDSAKIGSDNISGELPLLKVHAVGKSTKNELASGEEPKDGNFFYKPTLEEFDSIDCHILTISRGFRAPGLEDGKTTFNQIIGGVILDDEVMKPFIMYMTGLKLQPMWDFGREVSKYTHMRPVPIPMFALTVTLTTEKKANNFGKSWIVKFEIQKKEDSSPVIVMNPEVFIYLRDHVAVIEETIEQIIYSKVEKKEEKPMNEDVNPADIPF